MHVDEPLGGTHFHVNGFETRCGTEAKGCSEMTYLTLYQTCSASSFYLAMDVPFP